MAGYSEEQFWANNNQGVAYDGFVDPQQSGFGIYSEIFLDIF